jgi:hypothetical protein
VAEPKGHPLDGVRPRHTVCPACGYQHGGLPIRAGIIVCPECGATMDFDLRREKRRARRPPRRVTLWLLLAIAMAMAVLYILL